MNILFLTPRLPYPPIKGDKLRAYHQIRHLSEKHNIFLLSFLESNDEQRHVPILKEMCREVVTVLKTPWHSYLSTLGALLSPRPLQVGYYSSRVMSQEVISMLKRHHINLIHIQTIRMAPYAREIIEIPRFLDSIDLISLNYQRRLKAKLSALTPLLRMEYQRLTAYERQMIERTDFTSVVSQADLKEVGLDLNPKVLCLPNGVDTDYFKPSRAEYEHGSLLFTGNMGYYPNVEATKYFCNSIFPGLLDSYPNLNFYIVGANPSKQVLRLAKQPSVVVTGTVPDVRPYYDRAHVFVCPLQSGGGIQNKVLEAMAMGLPVVSTLLSNGGIGAQHGKHILIADQPEKFAEHVMRLLKDSSLREKLGQAGQNFVRENFSWTVHSEQLDKIYQSLVFHHYESSYPTKDSQIKDSHC